MENLVKLREDLNDIVKDIKFKRINTKYNSRDVAIITLFNDAVIEFKDNQGLYDLFTAYRSIGNKNFIKSKKLVEEFKTDSADVLVDDVDEVTNTYICVLFELEDGRTLRIFPSRRFTDRRIIDLYYEQYKKLNANKKQVVNKDN